MDKENALFWGAFFISYKFDFYLDYIRLNSEEKCLFTNTALLLSGDYHSLKNIIMPIAVNTIIVLRKSIKIALDIRF